MTSTSLISRLLLALALAGLLGCKQEEGDTCWEDDDCSGALVCCKPEPRVELRGSCLPAGEPCVDPDRDPADLGSADFGTEDDMGAESDMGEELDMGEQLDSGAEADGGPEDMGAEEDGGPDDMGADPDGGDEDMG